MDRPEFSGEKNQRHEIQSAMKQGLGLVIKVPACTIILESGYPFLEVRLQLNCATLIHLTRPFISTIQRHETLMTRETKRYFFFFFFPPITRSIFKRTIFPQSK